MDDARHKPPIPRQEESRTPRLSAGDPPPTEAEGRPPVVLIVVIALVVIALVVLHLTGVLGPGVH
jgi:hypothetical protein